MTDTFSISDIWMSVRNKDVAAIDRYLAQPAQCHDISFDRPNNAWMNHLTALITHAVRVELLDVLDVILRHTPDNVLLDSSLRVAIQRGDDEIALRLIDHASTFWCSDLTFGDCLATNNDTILRRMMARGLDPTETEHFQQMTKALEADQVECVQAVVEAFPDCKGALMRSARWKERISFDMLDVIYDFEIVQEMMDDWNSKISNPDIHFAGPAIMAFHEREILRRASASDQLDKIGARARKM